LTATYLGSDRPEDWDWEGLLKTVGTIFPLPTEFSVAGENGRASHQAVVERLLELAEAAYNQREAQFGAETMRFIERAWLLRVIDQLWIQHLTAIDDLREGIGLRAYGQRDPLVEYKREAHEMWESLLDSIHHDVLYTIFHVAPRTEPVRRPQATFTNRDGDNGSGRRVKTPTAKVGRNEQCPCGSGRKYKRCHGR
jgi:preprotein translocase subunit SecA